MVRGQRLTSSSKIAAQNVAVSVTAPRGHRQTGVVGVVFFAAQRSSQRGRDAQRQVARFNFTRFNRFNSFSGNVIASQCSEPVEVNNFDDTLERAMHCPICEGHGTILGRLGAVLWYRCRQCGMLFSRPRR